MCVLLAAYWKPSASSSRLLGVSGVADCEESACKNKAKPMFVFDTNVSKVFDGSVLKGGVAQAMGRGLTLAPAARRCGAALGARPRRAAGEAQPPGEAAVALPVFSACRASDAPRALCGSLGSGAQRAEPGREVFSKSRRACPWVGLLLPCQSPALNVGAGPFNVKYGDSSGFFNILNLL